MTPAQDSVLERALGDVLGARCGDMAERVLARLKQAGAERAPGEPAFDARQDRRLWLAAAALVLVGSLLVARALRDRDGALPTTTLATADLPLGVLRAGERELTLASGDSLRMGPCSLVTLDRDERGLLVEPRLGSFTLRTDGRAPARVRTRLGTAAPAGPSELRTEMLADGYDLRHPERFQQLAQEIHMKAALPVIVTLATLVQGAALLESEGGARSLAPGETLQVEGTAAPHDLV